MQGTELSVFDCMEVSDPAATPVAHIGTILINMVIFTSATGGRSEAFVVELALQIRMTTWASPTTTFKLTMLFVSKFKKFKQFMSSFVSFGHKKEMPNVWVLGFLLAQCPDLRFNAAVSAVSSIANLSSLKTWFSMARRRTKWRLASLIGAFWPAIPWLVQCKVPTNAPQAAYVRLSEIESKQRSKLVSPGFCKHGSLFSSLVRFVDFAIFV